MQPGPIGDVLATATASTPFVIPTVQVGELVNTDALVGVFDWATLLMSSMAALVAIIGWFIQTRYHLRMEDRTRARNEQLERLGQIIVYLRSCKYALLRSVQTGDWSDMLQLLDIAVWDTHRDSCYRIWDEKFSLPGVPDLAHPLARGLEQMVHVMRQVSASAPQGDETAVRDVVQCIEELIDAFAITMGLMTVMAHQDLYRPVFGGMIDPMRIRRWRETNLYKCRPAGAKADSVAVEIIPEGYRFRLNSGPKSALRRLEVIPAPD